MDLRKSFTLIELIVVVVIIALLATLGLNSYSRIQKQARDTKRINDMRELKNALLIYRSMYKTFPANTDNDCSGWDTSYDGDFIRNLENPNIIEKIPSDPLNKDSAACDGHGTSNKGFNYFYYRYNASQAASYGCSPTQPFIVLGVGTMESSNGAHPQSPGFSCTNRDWHGTLDYVIGIYE